MGLLFCFIWYLVPSVCLQKTFSTLTLFLCFQNAPIKCINLDKIDKWLALRVQDLLCILRSVQCQGTRCDGSIRCIPFRSGSGSKVFRVELEVVGIKQCLGLFAELWLRQVHVQQRLLDNQCPISKRNASLIFCIPLRRTLLLKLRNSLFEGWEAWQLQLLLPRHGEYLLANQWADKLALWQGVCDRGHGYFFACVPWRLKFSNGQTMVHRVAIKYKLKTLNEKAPRYQARTASTRTLLARRRGQEGQPMLQGSCHCTNPFFQGHFQTNPHTSNFWALG